MLIALASPRVASSIDDALDKVKQSISEAANRGAAIVCFPEAYLPGLRGQDFEVPPFDRAQEERALRAVAQWAQAYRIVVIHCMERHTDAGRQIAAFVIDAGGRLLGVQTKNQLDPSEDRFYVPRQHAPPLRNRRREVRYRDLPRRLSLSRDGALGGGARRQNRLSSAPHRL